MHNPFWTPDSELERYVNATREPLDKLGDLSPYFLERAKALSFDLSFTQSRFQDVQSWRSEAGAELARGMALPEKREIRNIHVLKREEREDHIREEVEFESEPGLRVPATVLIPKTGKPPYPAVVGLHDMGGFRAFGREKLIAFDGEPQYLTDFRKICYGGRSVGLELVKRGFLFIAIDALMFGERAHPADSDKEAFLRDRLTWGKEQAREFSIEVSDWDRGGFTAAILTGATWAGMVVHDDMATVDYLVSRPDVDPKRIGCVGLSFGAYRANYLAALEERIVAPVSVCWIATTDSVIGYNVCGAMGYFTMIPGVNTRLDICDIPSLACPRPYMAISGWQDLLMRPFGIAEAHKKLRAVYEKAGVPDQLGSLIFDAPHEFNVEMQERAFEWFEKRLGRFRIVHQRV